MKYCESLENKKHSTMISLKQSWSWFRRSQKSESNIVRSNSFTLQLSPKYFENVQPAPSSSSKPSIQEPSSSNDSIINNNNNNMVLRHNRMQHGSQRVRYIFSVPVTRRPTTFHMLQRPLKKVYLAYMNKHYASVPAILQITSNGLRCQHVKCDGTDVVESFNQFQTIAFWAAVQCVVRSGTSKDGKSGLRMGFFPFAENGQCLVEDDDDDNDEREPLLSENMMDISEETFRHFIWLDKSEQNWNLLQADHQPFFACVMRMNVPPHALQCHVFLCSSSQQAITLASSLYNKLSAHINHLKLRQDMRLFIRGRHDRDIAKERSSMIRNTEVQQEQDSKSFRYRLNETTKLKTTICGLCKREYTKKSFGHSPNRSKSFSQLLVRLRRLTLGDVIQSSSTFSPTVTKQEVTGFSEDTLEKRESCEANERHRFRQRISLLNDVDQSPGDSVSDVQQSNETRSCNSELHSSNVTRCRLDQHRHRPNLPANTPLWLKFLLELGLRQSSQSVNKPLLSSSRLSRTKTTNRKQHSFRPRLVPVTRNLTDWLSFESSKATRRNNRHSESVTQQLQDSWSLKCQPRFTTRTRRNSNDEAYAEVLETMVSCEQRSESRSSDDIVSFDTSGDYDNDGPKVLNLPSVFEAKKCASKMKADEMASMKKDAEIVSILEQINQNRTNNIVPKQLDVAMAREEPLLTQKNIHWGCSTFLP